MLLTRTREISTAITMHKKHTAAKFVFIKINPTNTLLGNSPHSEIFWSIFSHVRKKYFSPNAGKYESEKLRIRTIHIVVDYSHLLEEIRTIT